MKGPSRPANWVLGAPIDKGDAKGGPNGKWGGKGGDNKGGDRKDGGDNKGGDRKDGGGKDGGKGDRPRGEGNPLVQAEELIPPENPTTRPAGSPRRAAFASALAADPRRATTGVFRVGSRLARALHKGDVASLERFACLTTRGGLFQHRFRARAPWRRAAWNNPASRRSARATAGRADRRCREPSAIRSEVNGPTRNARGEAKTLSPRRLCDLFDCLIPSPVDGYPCASSRPTEAALFARPQRGRRRDGYADLLSAQPGGTFASCACHAASASFSPSAGGTAPVPIFRTAAPVAAASAPRSGPRSPSVGFRTADSP